MSDLQCPARILWARSTVSEVVLGALVTRERVARTVVAGTGEVVDPGELADLHRGETVLVVADDGPHVARGQDLLLVEIDGDGQRFTTLDADTVAREVGFPWIQA